MFRTLEAREIECRVQQVKENGAVLLLYKDARCDQNILDETVGAYNWQRSHSRDNANCTVSIWDEKKEQWISKEDTGTESNTEAQKGLASDSFKRACFNWGIGRELYTSPFIWIPSDKVNIKPKGNGFVTYDQFEVSKITYNDKREISTLEIVNAKTKAVVFTKGAPAHKDYTSGSFNPKCADCGAIITVAQHDLTAKKYKKPLCSICTERMRSETEQPIQFKCDECGEVITPWIKDGKTVMGVRQISENSRKEYGKQLCLECIRKAQAVKALESHAD